MNTRTAALSTVLALLLAGTAQAQTMSTTTGMQSGASRTAVMRPPVAVHLPVVSRPPHLVHHHFFGRHPFFFGRHPFFFGPGLIVTSPVAADPPASFSYPVPVYVPYQAYAQPQGQSDYWAYCQDPQGYYPYVAQCPSGWLPVAPTSMPPPRLAADPSPKQASASMSIDELRERIKNSRAD